MVQQVPQASAPMGMMAVIASLLSDVQEESLRYSQEVNNSLNLCQETSSRILLPSNLLVKDVQSEDMISLLSRAFLPRYVRLELPPYCSLTQTPLVFSPRCLLLDVFRFLHVKVPLSASSHRGPEFRHVQPLCRGCLRRLPLEKHMQVEEREVSLEDAEENTAIGKLIASLNIERVKRRFIDKGVDVDGLCCALNEMKSMIGIGNVKESILGNICYLLSCKLSAGCLSPEKLHAAFIGEPGTGKTTMSIIFAKILICIGLGEKSYHQEDNHRSLRETALEMVNVMKTEYPSSYQKGVRMLSELMEAADRMNVFPHEEGFVLASRVDFVAGYQGQTAQRAEDFLSKHDGKIIIIDESYSLCYGAEDNYGREALDVIMSRMSSVSNRSIFFFNGYNDEIINNLFGSQRGMERRVHNFFFFDSYSTTTLEKIFMRQASKMNLIVDERTRESFPIMVSLFNVKSNGGDMEKLSLRCKILIISGNFADILRDNPETDCLEERVVSIDIFNKALTELFVKREGLVAGSFTTG